MAHLKFTDKMQLEKLLGMSTGYVLNFSHRTFQEFVRESVDRDIFEERFVTGHSGSKANCLRSFWKAEPDHVVGKLLVDLVDYFRRINHDAELDEVANDCEKIAKRLIGEDTMDDHRPLVFISYARPDAHAARALDQLLDKAGLRTWFDKKDLMGGEDWKLVIRERIADARVFLVCLSSRAVDRTGFFHQEMRYALEAAGRVPRGRVYIVPVRIDECEIPVDLQNWHVIDLCEQDGSAKLLRSIASALTINVDAPRATHEAFTQAVCEVFPFSLREGEEFVLDEKLLGDDHCMYEVKVSHAIVGSRAAKVLVRVRRHVVGRPVETTHDDTHAFIPRLSAGYCCSLGNQPRRRIEPDGFILGTARTLN